MNDTVKNGIRKEKDGLTSVYYDGYWVKCYTPPVDTLTAKKDLIQSLTRRLFNHMEHGINIPGKMLDEVSDAYEAETDHRKKRVKGAMLAGALFNRAADIFTSLVELEAKGVEIKPSNDLMRTCGKCLEKALEYGKMVKHRNGDEGIDELWGEPFKAFIMPVEEFYESRYVKIAMTMKNIDQVATFMSDCIKKDCRFAGLESLILNYALTAKNKCETLRTDDNVLDVWSDFVVAGEAIIDFAPDTDVAVTNTSQIHELDIRYLLKQGCRLMAFITRARTPMPVSTQNYFNECKRYSEKRKLQSL
ncbi:MAG: hypothetical protein OQK98_16020 [Gammaproteobacteria bacterium]|nr:hypothetical protein [Gammaproteobacteria bacterium]